MSSNIAPLRGTTSLYCYLEDSKVLIMKDGYKYMTISVENFHYLYYEIDGQRAALKEDCMEYCTYYPNKPIEDYPQWFRDAMNIGRISEYYHGHVFYEDGIALIMELGSVVLRNFKGELRYMEPRQFNKYYDVGEGYCFE